MSRFKERVISGIPAIIFPGAMFLYFCAQNMSVLRIWFALLGTIIITVAGAILFLAISTFVRDYKALNTFCIVIWGGFFFETAIYDLFIERCSVVFHRVLGSHWRFISETCLIFLFSLIAAFVIHKVSIVDYVVHLITLTICVLFLFNLIRVIVGGGGSDGDEYIKQSYNVAKLNKEPNIYWIQPDGMLGFDAFEEYYGDNQSNFKSELEDRGFSIAENASFESTHSTNVAIPMLTCPYAYDEFLSERSTDHKTAMKELKYSLVGNIAENLRQNGEIQTAFTECGYDVSVIGPIGYFYPSPGGYMYFWDDDKSAYRYSPSNNEKLKLYVMLGNICRISQYFDWICQPIRIPLLNGVKNENYEKVPFDTVMEEQELKKVMLNHANDERVNFIKSTYDCIYGNHKTPRLIFIHDLLAHFPFNLDENGERIETKYDYDPLLYKDQHIYSGKVLINFVDMIINADPKAIIIIQSDHGLHQCTEKDFYNAFGEDADPVKLWNSTFSAWRVPDEYKTGEEEEMAKTPLNISRYLINTFVGKNYEYLK